MTTFELLAIFALVSIASHRIGKWFTAIGLPYITGYLAAGAVAGWFVLELLPVGAEVELRFVDEISLGLIAFVAGSELYIPELRDRVRTILTMAGAISVAGLAIIGGTVGGLATVASFGDVLGGAEIVAMAVLGGTVLLALSPPSTIAVIKEVGARGRFTSTALSLTIVMDVVVVVAFAASASVAGALLGDGGLQLSFIPILLLDLTLACIIGFTVGKVIAAYLRLGLPLVVNAAVVLSIGFGIYEAADFVSEWSVDAVGFEIYLEPLLATLIAGTVVTNFTDQRHTFEHVLHKVSPAVYVAFFTLTGVSLKLDTLLAVLPVAAVLFVVRIVAIAVGTTTGARLARETGHIASKSWLALITQAGIALGLAREASIQFPSLGDAFATLIVAVIVLNEIFGPMLLKYILNRVDEVGQGDGRRALIYGVDRNALQLAERLEAAGWATTLADDEHDHVAEAEQAERSRTILVLEDAEQFFADLDQLPDTVVAMGGDDDANLDLCRAAVEAGIERTVARMSHPDLLDDFHDIGTLVIDPTSAATALIEDAVRTPDAAELVLHADPNREVMQIKVKAASADGRPVRDLRLPDGILLLALRRRGTVISPDGFTTIKRGDDLTMIGEPGELREVASQLM